MIIAYIVYTISIPLYIIASKQNNPKKPIFNTYEKVFVAIIIIAAIANLFYTITNDASLVK